jgi:glycosyltransferase involved in cell wall biosynthesis
LRTDRGAAAALSNPAPRPGRRLTVIQLLPALAGGGVERGTLEIADALVAAGHRSLVVSAGGRLVEPLTRGGSTHVALDIGRKSLATLRHVANLRALFARERPDIVHARSRLPAWLAWLALRTLPAPRPHFVTSVHGLNSPGWYSGVLTRGERVICVSGTVRDHVLAHWPDCAPRLRLVEHGIDPAHFPRLPAAADAAAEAAAGTAALPSRRLHLLLPGRGTRLKGHAAAIELLGGLVRAGTDADLRLLGAREPGRERYLDELLRQAATLGVAERVAIDPPTGAIAAAYRDSDLVLQLSRQPESFGRTVLEALSVGTPVVGWDLGGVGELLARHFPEGRVPAFSSDALLATTLRLLAGGSRPGPLQARTLAAMQGETLEVYESVAG